MSQQEGTGNGPSKQTVVEEGTALRGALVSDGSVLVMGRVEGEVSGVAVEVTETGAISGRIKTPALRSRGELAGQIEAQDVELAGHVLDETVIRAEALTVTLPATGGGAAAAVFGDCALEIGEAPQPTYVPADPPAKPRPGGGRRRRPTDEEAR